MEETMTTIVHEGDAIRKAIEWIDHAKTDNPSKKILQLIDEAGMRFNLAPKDTDFLVRFFSDKH
jgi:cellobiose-specific phosphotransferase system component IIA